MRSFRTTAFRGTSDTCAPHATVIKQIYPTWHPPIGRRRDCCDFRHIDPPALSFRSALLAQRASWNAPSRRSIKEARPNPPFSLTHFSLSTNQLPMAAMQDLKVTYASDIRRLKLPSSARFDDLVALLASVYSVPPTGAGFAVKYKDDEGDLVTISCDAELAHAVDRAGGGLLRLELFPADGRGRRPAPTGVPFCRPLGAPGPGPGRPAHKPYVRGPHGPPHHIPPPPAGPPHAPPPHVPLPHVPPPHMPLPHGPPLHVPPPHVPPPHARPPHVPPPPHGPPPMYGPPPHGPPPHAPPPHGPPHGPPPGPPPPPNDLDLSRLLSLLSSPALAPLLSRISPSTRASITSLVSDLSRTLPLPTIFAAAPIALPTLSAFLSRPSASTPSELSSRGESLLRDLSPAISGLVGPANWARIASAVRTALADPAARGVLDALGPRAAAFGAGGIAGAAAMRAARGGSSAGDAAARDPGREAARAAAEREADIPQPSLSRFDVHDACCSACRSPIIGVRHMCLNRRAGDLCEACYANPATDKTGLEFRSVPLPWLTEDPDRLIPFPTLALDDRGVEVRFLQKILVDFGFLTLDAIPNGVGTYCRVTADAVNRFRAHYGLETQGAFGVYDEIVAASFLSVLESGVPPAAAAGASAGRSSAAGAAQDGSAAAS